jgi:hypothetical protein
MGCCSCCWWRCYCCSPVRYVDGPLLSLLRLMDIAAYIVGCHRNDHPHSQIGNMLIISPETLMVVGTSTIGASGLLTVDLPVYVIVQLSLEEIFLVRRMRYYKNKKTSSRSKIVGTYLKFCLVI